MKPQMTPLLQKAVEIAEKYAVQYNEMNSSRPECRAAALEMAEYIVEEAGKWWEVILRQGSPEAQAGLELLIEKFKNDMLCKK